MRWLWIAALLTGCGGGSSTLKPSLPLTEFILQDPATYTNGEPVGPIESRTLHCGSQSGQYSLAVPIPVEKRLPAEAVSLPNGTVFCAASVIVTNVPSDYSNEVRLQCQGGRCVLR